MITRFRDDKAWGWQRSLPVLGVAALLWVLALRSTNIDVMTDIGLLSVLPVTHFVALIIVIVGFCVLIHRGDAPEAVYIAYTLSVILMIHTLPPLLYSSPRYSWAWKHMGIIDYIMRNDTVNPAIGVRPEYHNWPGFFALFAMLTEAAGLKSPVSFALWAEVAANILNFIGLMLILRALTTDRRLIWLSALFFCLTNWIGQDYFSPQAMAYYLYLVIAGICLRWFRSSWMVPLPEKSRWPLLQRGLAKFNGLMDRAHQTTLDPVPADPYTRFVLIVMIVLASVVIVASHQLTPIMLIMTIFILTVFRQSSIKGMPTLIVFIFLGWSFSVAHRYIGKEVWPLIDSALEVSRNVSGGFIRLSDLSPGQQVVAVVGRLFTVFIWGIAVIGGVRRLRSESIDLAAAFLLLGPMLVPIINPYGGEILFRVYLFTLPVIAFLCASVIYPSKVRGTNLRWVGAASILCIIFAAGLYLVYFGKDRQYRFTQNEIDGANYLYTVAPENSLLVQGSWNYPTQFINYDRFVYVPITLEPDDVRAHIRAEPVEVLSRWLDNDRYAETYLLITRSMKIQINTLGELPFNMLDDVEAALLASDKFILVYQNEDVLIFTLNREMMRSAR